MSPTINQIMAGAMMFATSVACAIDFHVATGGNDANPGTEARPFASLERARDAVRALGGSSILPAGGVTVWIEPGTYARTQTWELTGADSGAVKAPVIYRASAGGEQTYTVKSGDNLTKIAGRMGTTIKALRAENGLKTDSIKVGQKLKIPAKAAASVAVPAVPVESATTTPPVSTPTTPPAR